MIYIIIGILGISIYFIVNQSEYNTPKLMRYKYINPIYTWIHRINESFAFLVGMIGTILLCVYLLVMLITTFEAKKTVAQFNYNPCSMYRINDKIAQHRAFESDIFYGMFYSSDVADLPYIKCKHHKIYESVPRGEE